MVRKGDFRTMASHGLLHLIVEQGLRQHLVVSTFDSFFYLRVTCDSHYLVTKYPWTLGLQDLNGLPVGLGIEIGREKREKV